MINLKFGNVIKIFLTLGVILFTTSMLCGCDKEYTSDSQLMAPPASQSKSHKELPASRAQEQEWDGYKKDHQLGVKIPIHPDLPEETSTKSE